MSDISVYHAVNFSLLHEEYSMLLLFKAIGLVNMIVMSVS